MAEDSRDLARPEQRQGSALRCGGSPPEGCFEVQFWALTGAHGPAVQSSAARQCSTRNNLPAHRYWGGAAAPIPVASVCAVPARLAVAFRRPVVAIVLARSGFAVLRPVVPLAVPLGTIVVAARPIPIRGILALTVLVGTVPVRPIPLRPIPVSSVPVSSIPISFVPVRSIPVRSIPVRTIAVWAIPSLVPVVSIGAPIAPVVVSGRAVVAPAAGLDRAVARPVRIVAAVGRLVVAAARIAATRISRCLAAREGKAQEPDHGKKKKLCPNHANAPTLISAGTEHGTVAGVQMRIIGGQNLYNARASS